MSEHGWLGGIVGGPWQVHVFYEDSDVATDYNGVDLDSYEWNGRELLEIQATSALEIAEAEAQFAATGSTGIPCTVLATFAIDKDSINFQGGEFGFVGTRVMGEGEAERPIVIRIEPAMAVKDGVQGFDVDDILIHRDN